MAFSINKRWCVFPIVLVVNLSLFACSVLGNVNTEMELNSQPSNSHGSLESRTDENVVQEAVNSYQIQSSQEHQINGEKDDDENRQDNASCDAEGDRADLSKENSSRHTDYFKLLASYMRPEVFQKFVKGLNKTLDAHTRYSHPEFTYANTTKETGSQKRVKYPCIPRPIANRTARVRIVNNTELMEVVVHKTPSRDNSTSVLGGYCTFVMFFAPWCKFSAAAAPAFNAIGRAFPDMEVLAINAIQYNSLNTRFGIVAVPNILLFHNSKPVMRFNYSQRTFDVFSGFIRNFTGLEPNTSVQVSDIDLQGPLSSIAAEEPDYALWLSWLFLALVAVWFITQCIGSAVMDRIRTFVIYARQVWRTGEFYDQVGVLVHEHND